MQGTILHQHGGDGAAALVQTGFHHGALGSAVGVSLQFLHIGNQQDHFQQVINTLFVSCGNGNTGSIAAPLFGNQFIFGELLLHQIRVCSGLIHFVDGHDNGNACGLGVVDCLYGLGHDAVIGSHHQHGDIGYLCTAGTHGGKSGVAGGVQEGDVTAVNLHAVCTDVLGNAAGLAGGDVCVTDGVQQAGFAVVNVAHDHHNGGTGNQIGIVVFTVVDNPLFDGDDHFFFHLGVEFHGHQAGGIKVDHIVDSCHSAHHHQLFDDFGSGCLQAHCQLAHSDFVGNLHGDGLCLALQGNPAQTLGLGLLAGSAGLAAALALLGDLLLLHGVVGANLFGSQTVIFFVVALNVHMGSARIHQTACGLLDGVGFLLDSRLLLRSRSGLGLRLCSLLLGLLLCAVVGALLALLLAVCGAAAFFIVIGILMILFSGLFRFLLLHFGPGAGIFLCLGGFGLIICKICVKIFRLMGLGEAFQHQIQLFLCQRGHVFLGFVAVLLQNIENKFIGHVQVFCHFVHPIFQHHRISLPFSALPDWASCARSFSFSANP